jgi:anaerobic magnesium-protoporphyrin IX monomethyl ester cyclase
MRQLRIALADPPKKESYYHTSFANLGLLYLAGSLRERLGQRCTTILLDGHQDLAGHISALEVFRPHIYGLSFTYFTRHLAYKVMREVRSRLGDVLIICGGAMPSAAPSEVLKASPADICVQGEGEAAICELAKCILNGDGGLDGIEGLVFRDNRGRIKITPKRKPVSDLDSIPFPAFDMVDYSHFPGWHMHRSQPQAVVLVSRGCPYDCNFCSNPVWKYNKPWLRYRSPANIAKEVEQLYRIGISEIYLSADEINFSESWALEVCEALAELGHGDLWFNCNIRPDVMTTRLAKAFRKANLWCAHLGIDSANPRVLKGVGKKVNLEQISEACRILKSENLNVFGFVMLFHAWEEDGQLRWETPPEVENTLNYCRNLLSQRLLDYISWQVTTPMPGSRLWDLAQKHQLLPSNEATNIFSRNMLLPGVEERHVRMALIKGLWLKNYYLARSGKMNWRQFPAIWPNLRVMLGFPPPKGAY